MASSGLPSFALFPIAAWRDELLPDEWVSCLNAWSALIDSHLSLSDAEFLAISAKDSSLPAFLSSFVHETAQNGAGILGSSTAAKRLLQGSLKLTTKLLHSPSPPSTLAQWEFLADLSRLYGKKKVGLLLSSLSAASQGGLDASLADLKKFLIQNLDAGLDGGDLKGIQERLERISDLIHTSPAVAEFFLSGSDFLDGLISCYKITNPPLRKALISTTFLCLVGLAEGQKFSALTDQLYSLKAAAAAHKSGPLNVNDSLVAELVTSTPLTQQLLRKLEESSDQVPTRTKSVLTELDTFKKPGSSLSKPKRLIRRKINKGKGVALAVEAHAEHQQEMHIHRMSQISQIQDLFPELGSGFVAKLLDEYGDGNTEEVVAHLLEDSLPEHLRSADRSEQLSTTTAAATTTTIRRSSSALAPRSTPPIKPAYLSDDEDEGDEDLALLTSSNLQIGKSSLRTADSLLAAHPTSTQKASILSALAAFDSDDDERDDTYDAADVGGTVDASQGDEILPDGAEARLFGAWSANPKLFERAPGARRSAERARLKDETGMSDEQVEGWGLMLERDPKLQKRLAGRYGEWDGRQSEVESRKGRWKEDLDDGAEEAASGSGSDFPGGGRGGGGGGGGYRGRGRGRGGGGRGRGGHGGDAAPPPPPDSETARRRKEANKGSRANHNRRDQRAKKMARGGAFPG
ncbi:CUE domain-containing protein 3 [Cladorrhinum samala]|uniref:CUE domain-containing protein 3 n=1 Tax=Cladorrhinum samala TaxID=585594 RepID=A0AAV9HWD3_9PEZI|nr:CUE domain-containing protein 3 [Cladorrhinum samala]